jgi:hypothetical protein
MKTQTYAGKLVKQLKIVAIGATIMKDLSLNKFYKLRRQLKTFFHISFFRSTDFGPFCVYKMPTLVINACLPYTVPVDLTENKASLSL